MGVVLERRGGECDDDVAPPALLLLRANASRRFVSVLQGRTREGRRLCTCPKRSRLVLSDSGHRWKCETRARQTAQLMENSGLLRRRNVIWLFFRSHRNHRRWKKNEVIVTTGRKAELEAERQTALIYVSPSLSSASASDLLSQLAGEGSILIDM